jgi:predicted PhzF superfamily epimerase YddE/YHI9
MELPIITVDAFTETPFAGNPAAICLLPWEISEQAMQWIAAEMNLSETAFLETKGEQTYKLRWFTPTHEVDLCGHATLAAAFLLFTEELASPEKPITFLTKSGELSASMVDGYVQLDFPLLPVETASHPYFTSYFFGQKVMGAAKLTKNWILELENPKAVEYVMPVWQELAIHSEQGLIITSKGDENYDIYSRYFAPNIGIEEDPVTGFAHCALMDYWHKKLGNTSLKAFQASKRGGELLVELDGNRVYLKGKAVKMFEGLINIRLE